MADLIRRVTAWALSLRIVRAFLVYSGARGPALADSVTYRTLFSLFAAVLIGFSFAAVWLSGNPDALTALERSVNNVVPGLVGPDNLLDVSKLDAPASSRSRASSEPSVCSARRSVRSARCARRCARSPG